MAGLEDEVAPPDLKFPCLVFDVAFHPTQDIIATGLVSGSLQLFQYSHESCKKVISVPLHTEGIRSLAFTTAGDRLFTASSDKSVKCLDATGKVVWSQLGAHDDAVNVVTPLAESLIASGDENGVVKIWDTRIGGSAAAAASMAAAAASAAASTTVSFSKQTDVITDLKLVMDKAALLATSGDGSLGVYDLRRMKLGARSEPTEDELLSIALIKGGTAVVTGTQEGVLLVWDWGKWAWTEADEDSGRFGPERFKGHPASVDALLVVDDDTIVTGSSDGLIRMCTIRPNKLIGMLGEHGDDPIECLTWSRDRRLLASASHDNMVRFWDVGYLFDDSDDDDDEDASGAAGAGAGAGAGGAAAKGKKGKASAAAAAGAVAGAAAGGVAAAAGGSKFTGMAALSFPDQGMDAEEDSEEDDDDDDDDEEDDEEEDDEGAAAGGAGAGAGRAMGGAGGPRRGMDEDDDDDDDDAPRGKKKGKAAASSSSAAAGGKGRGGSKGGKKGGGGGGFFDDL